MGYEKQGGKREARRDAEEIRIQGTDNSSFESEADFLTT